MKSLHSWGQWAASVVKEQKLVKDYTKGAQ